MRFSCRLRPATRVADMGNHQGNRPLTKKEERHKLFKLIAAIIVGKLIGYLLAEIVIGNLTTFFVILLIVVAVSIGMLRACTAA